MPLILIVAGGIRRDRRDVAGRFSDFLMARPQCALDQQSDELAFLDGLPRPISVSIPAIGSPTGRAWAESAMDAAFPVRHSRAPARRTRTGSGPATGCPFHLSHGPRRVSVHGVDLEKFWPPRQYLPLRRSAPKGAQALVGGGATIAPLLREGVAWLRAIFCDSCNPIARCCNEVARWLRRLQAP
jgi:hypothetical protein